MAAFSCANFGCPLPACFQEFHMHMYIPTSSKSSIYILNIVHSPVITSVQRMFGTLWSHFHIHLGGVPSWQRLFVGMVRTSILWKHNVKKTMVCSWPRNLNFVLQPSKASVESQFELLQEIDVVVKCVCQLIVAVELCSFSSGEGSGQQLCSFPIG